MASEKDIALETSLGRINLELYYNHAPKTCKNFATLVSRGYYNGTGFHRIMKDFMVQGGDPLGTGQGGESCWGGQFEDEQQALKTLRHVGAGVLSMANSGPDTNRSQFFITLAPTPWLDGKHVIFGRVKSGLKIVDRMGKVRTDKKNKPLDAIKIEKALIESNKEDLSLI